MNIVAKYVPNGISEWKKAGAKVKYLKSGKISVPVIEFTKGKKLVIFVSGFHLEETSGPILLLSPKKMLMLLTPLIRKNISILIYPVINQYGLSFSEHSDENLLRNNAHGINYNDKWGIPDGKPEEIVLIESDILKTVIKYNPLLALSLHEDSVTPGKGYIWFNGVKSKEVRKKIITEIKSAINDSLTLKIEKDVALEMKEPQIESGKVEEGFAIIDAKDKGAFENWLADDLKIPVALSEAPFGLDLKVREEFHKVVMKSAIKNLV